MSLFTFWSKKQVAKPTPDPSVGEIYERSSKYLSDQNLECVTAWLNQHCQEIQCPACSNQHFALQKTLGAFDAVMPNGNGIVYPRQQYPVLVLACDKCGYLFQFSATLLGIIKQNIKEEGENRAVSYH